MSPEPSPEAQAIARELSSPTSRDAAAPPTAAVLVLRDVWLAGATSPSARQLDAAVNSALQRARADREQDEGTLTRLHAPTDAGAEAAVLREFLDAWAEVNVPRIVALLSDDALLTMPPVDVRIRGAGAIGEFFATQPAGGRLARIRHTVTRANGQPALASYADEHDTGTHDAYGVMVLAIAGTRIAGITGFPHDLELFTQLGLPLTQRPGRQRDVLR